MKKKEENNFSPHAYVKTIIKQSSLICIKFFLKMKPFSSTLY